MGLLDIHLNNIRIPNSRDNIYKGECVYSYDTPESPNGLYVSMSSFFGFGEAYVEGYFKKTHNAVFLHILREKRELPTKKYLMALRRKLLDQQ